MRSGWCVAEAAALPALALVPSLVLRVPPIFSGSALVEELQLVNVRHRAVPGPGCPVVLDSQGIQWQPWTRSLLGTTWPGEQETCTLWAFQRSARPQGPPHPPLPSCSLFPTGVKQLQSGLAERAPGTERLGSGNCCVLPSLNQGCELQDASRPPAVLAPEDASFLHEAAAAPVGCSGLCDGEGDWGSLPFLQLLSTSGHIHPFLPSPTSPAPSPLPSCSLRNQWAGAPVCSAGEKPTCLLKEQSQLCPLLVLGPGKACIWVPAMRPLCL